VFLSTSDSGSHVFVSPHLDDAVLSCGGVIAELSRRQATVIVATIFAGEPVTFSPLAAALHAKWNLDHSISKRKAEDVSACARIGATVRHLDFFDAIYRSDPNKDGIRYPSIESLYNSPSRLDDSLLLELGECLRAMFIELVPRAVYSPAAVGSHVDHVLAKRSVHLALADIEEMIQKPDLYLYEDLPYSARSGSLVEFPNLLSSTPTLSRDAKRRKVEAIKEYRSQLDMLWPSGRIDEELTRHSNRLAPEVAYTERFWQVSQRG